MYFDVYLEKDKSVPPNSTSKRGKSQLYCLMPRVYS